MAAPFGAFAQYTADATVKTLVHPDGANSALIQCETADVRWTDDGQTNPTTTVGFLLQAGQSLTYDANLGQFRFTRAGASNGQLNVQPYGK